jgi:hypothetical protein
VSLRVVHSNKSSVVDAVRDLHAGLADRDNRLVLCFASPRFEPSRLSTQLREVFGPVPVIGCTTAGELAGDEVLKGSVVAMALDASALRDVCVEVIDLERCEPEVARACGVFEKHFGMPMREMRHDQYAGLVLFDGLSGAEERVMEALGNHSNVPFVGGSAGDDLQFKATHVFAHGQARQRAAVLALLRPSTKFEIIKTQSFREAPGRLVVTRADPATRTVFEFNGKPAAREYARLLGVSVEELPKQFMSHPLGLMVSPTEPFVRSPQRLDGDAVVFYCGMQEGMELSVLASTDMVEDTRAALAAAKARGPLNGIVNFQCILRTLQLASEGRAAAYGHLFAGVPTIGFSTYGEAYVGHINQTATMLVLH